MILKKYKILWDSFWVHIEFFLHKVGTELSFQIRNEAEIFVKK